MKEVYEPIQVGPGVLRRDLEEAKANGWRLAQAHACNAPGGYLLVYSVAKDYEIVHYELHIMANDEIESVSDIFPSAELYEQEMAELFGVKIKRGDGKDDIRLYHLQSDAPMK